MWSDFYPYGHMASIGASHWGLHVISWLPVLALILVALGALVWYLRRGTPGAGRRGESSALATLEERYARGEIDREEFLQKKKDLTS